MKAFSLGIKSYLFGIRALLNNSDLRRISILPLLLDLCLFAGAVYLICFYYFPVFVAGLLSGIGTGIFAQILILAGQTVAFILGLILSGVVTMALANWIASPFNSILAEKALNKFGALEDRPFVVSEWLRVTLKMAMVGIIRSLILLSFGFILFLLSFLPLFHLPVLFVGFFIISTDCLDYSLETFQLKVRDRFGFYRNNFLEISGFATMLGLTFLVPGLSFLLMPAAVIGAAHLASEIKKGKGLVGSRDRS